MTRGARVGLDDNHLAMSGCSRDIEQIRAYVYVERVATKRKISIESECLMSPPNERRWQFERKIAALVDGEKTPLTNPHR